jgi:hypothetical protein
VFLERIAAALLLLLADETKEAGEPVRLAK